MRFVFVYVPKPRFVIAGSPVAGCGPYGCQLRALRLPIAKRRKETGITTLCMKLCGIIYKALLYSVPEITGMKCGKKQRKQGIISFLSISVKCLYYRLLVWKSAKKG